MPRSQRPDRRSGCGVGLNGCPTQLGGSKGQSEKDEARRGSAGEAPRKKFKNEKVWVRRGDAAWLPFFHLTTHQGLAPQGEQPAVAHRVWDRPPSERRERSD